MKHITHYSSLLVMAAVLLLVSCEKDSDTLPSGTLTLTTEKHQSPAKTSVAGTTVQWVNEVDYVRLYLGENSVDNYPVAVDGDRAYTTLGDGISESELVRAYYPKTIITATGASNGNTNNPIVVIPRRYDSRYSGGRQVLELPLVAKGVVGDRRIEFKHLSAAIKVVVKNETGSEQTLDSVVVSSKDYLLGDTMKLDLTKSDYGILARTTTDSNAVTVRFTDAPTIASDGTVTVQVPIRPIGATAKPLRIEVFTHGLSNSKNNIAGAPEVYLTTLYHYSDSKDVSDLGRNKMMTAGIAITNAGHTSTEEIDNNSLFSVSSSKKVRFSIGNLKQNEDNWEFNTNQYTSTTSDLFPWVADFSTRISGWDVLSAEEWNYLINTRSGDRFAKACVNGVNGLIIFSDTYRHPIAQALVKVNYSGSMNYSDNTFTTSQWESMEAAGAIFLPAVHNGGGTGHYWSSNEGTSGNAKRLYFSDSELTTTVDEAQTNTCSVRLVKE